MSDQETAWILETIVPKSDQLNSDDLLLGEITVTVMGVREGTKEQRVKIQIDGGRQPYLPCKSMRRVLLAVWGKDYRRWKGRSMTLFRDPKVKWQGREVGGIRISHMSHIDTPKTTSFQISKGISIDWTVEPLKSNGTPPPTPSPVRDAIGAAMKSGRWTQEQVGELLKSHGATKASELSVAQGGEVLEALAGDPPGPSDEPDFDPETGEVVE